MGNGSGRFEGDKQIMELSGKKVLVVGCGKSGIGAAAFLLREGAYPVLFDENDKLSVEKVWLSLSEKIKACCCGEDCQLSREEKDNPGSPKGAFQTASGNSAKIYVGELPEKISEETELLVLSPGVPADTDFVEGFRMRGVPVWGEIELAYQREKGRVVAITGTNGKTTTTTLVGEIMAHHFETSFVMGNIGYPYTDIAERTTEASVTVGEISSFQLETIEHFHPIVSAILNITPDHLNRHHTMENYIAVKNNITKNQGPGDICVLNYENEATRKLGENCPAKVLYFSSKRRLENGACLIGEDIYLAKDGKLEKLMSIHEMKLVGLCNVENVMAAILIAETMKIPREEYLEVIRLFQAVEHRIEFVDSVNGVDYYNDSKGTNPDAAIQGIRAMSRPTLLIGGGYDKGSTFDEWMDAFDGKVKLLVLIGQTKEKIAACARSHGFQNIVFAETFEEAFQICADRAVPGDAVLLSPACASWGMFPNYEVRGKLFKEMVHKLEN